MKKQSLIALALLAAAAPLSSRAQQVLTWNNPLATPAVEASELTGLPLENLTDGNDLSVVTFSNVTLPLSVTFTTDRPFLAKGINIVIGSDCDKAPYQLVVYGRNDASDQWKSIGSYRVGVFSDPYTGYSGKTTSSTVPYTRFKFEITKIRNSADLEIAEIELLGTYDEDLSIATGANGSFSASSKATDPALPFTFKNALAQYGLADTWLQYDFDEPTAIGAYSLTACANTDRTARPRAWELLGSEDGETWHTLDMRANQGDWTADNFEYRRVPGQGTSPVDFAAAADELLGVMQKKFVSTWGKGKYLINSWHEDPSKMDYGYNYWWMAHAIDGCVDAYNRTGDERYRILAQDIREGMYTAYDASRYDLWNSYYDDMEWMNLACMRAYESFTRLQSSWLNDAVKLFGWIWQGWNYDNGSEGGIRWNSGSGTGKNSCSNAPAMIGAARLYQLTGEEQYLEKAVMIFDWMLTHSRFDDGFIKDAPDNDNRGWVFTYNQGTWVGGLLELYRITREQKYYDIAVDLIDKSIDDRWYTPDGIMREQGIGDGGMFKGIYIRYIANWVLSGFLDQEHQVRYATFLVENARSMVECALHKDTWTVMPDWKTRDSFANGEVNGASDGSYHSSVLLSGLFLLESVDAMRRAGILGEDYSVVNPAVGKKYSHYRVRFTSNYGSSDLNIGGFSLFGEGSTTAVGELHADGTDNIVVEGNRVSAADGSPVEVYAIDGRQVCSESLPAGTYIVRYSDGSTRKLRL
ncbi:MAG: hypothetical protein NC336_05990 [Clostridium sp.]|nr:hypothetical protein [Clostridium sp.]